MCGDVVVGTQSRDTLYFFGCALLLMIFEMAARQIIWLGSRTRQPCVCSAQIYCVSSITSSYLGVRKDYLARKDFAAAVISGMNHILR